MSATLGPSTPPNIRAPTRIALGAGPDDRASSRCDYSSMTRTLLIVDDHEGFRSWAREVLESEGFGIVGEAADGASAIKAVSDLHPEVVLLDVQLPDMNGFEVADRISTQAAIVLTSSRDAVDYGNRIARSPAAGFVPKAELTGAAIEAILNGLEGAR
jgi:DNA-binding NarL/FixJ family response regulator